MAGKELRPEGAVGADRALHAEERGPSEGVLMSGDLCALRLTTVKAPFGEMFSGAGS